MKSPLILISSGRVVGERSRQRQQSELYGACVTAAGGDSALFTGGNAIRLAQRFDGLLLSGGGDLHPSLYGQLVTDHRLSIDSVRDTEEAALFHAFCTQKKPILGICRGIQAINVFLGGTLHQHIDGHDTVCHAIACNESLRVLLRANPLVNSYHHQAVAQLGEGLEVVANVPNDGAPIQSTLETLVLPPSPLCASDGNPDTANPRASVQPIIEAIQHTTLPILGVQWHPERMVPPLCSDIEGANHLALFQWLLEQA